MDGKAASVPLFIQPRGEQNCLLGMNVLPALGVTVRRANGDLLVPSSEHSGLATVRLIQDERIPGKSGMFVEARVDGDNKEGDELMFEQDM